MDKWNQVRAISGFLEVVSHALQSIRAITPDDKPELANDIYELQVKISEVQRKFNARAPL